MTIPEVLDFVVQKLGVISSELDEIDAVLELDLLESTGGSYQLIISKERIEWLAGKPLKTTCLIQVSEENFYKIIGGKLNPTKAFLTGKVKIEGDSSQLLKLQSILSKHIKEIPRVT
ncbi:MAG: SCP2 sterol-binding domain-containing protein [Dethiobacteria bacterium]|nr:SCP2 sterol-binding domain-containing protein [Bacillota bacterium]